MRTLFSILLFLSMSTVIAQDLPYYEIPDEPKEYTAGTTASRMIDGLGFRYYWATEKLRPEDLAYKPSEKVRTTAETIDHILDLSKMILNCVMNTPNSKNDNSKLSFTEKRRLILENLKKASDILKQSNDVSQYKIIFGEKELPFWNAINGPIADALWHVGQVVSYRRSSGNPIPGGISVLTGKVKK